MPIMQLVRLIVLLYLFASPIYTCVLLQVCIATVSLGSLSTETLLVNYAVVKDGNAIAVLSTTTNYVLWLRAACTVASGARQCYNCATQQRTSASTESYTKWLPRLRSSSAGVPVSSQYRYFMTYSVSITDSLLWVYPSFVCWYSCLPVSSV